MMYFKNFISRKKTFSIIILLTLVVFCFSDSDLFSQTISTTFEQDLSRELEILTTEILGITVEVSEDLDSGTIVMTSSADSNLVLVTKVIDGDTIKIEGGQTVRYIGIDTPETVHPSKPRECFGKEASDKNKSLVAGRMVKLEKDVSETDRFGRLLRYVYVDDIFVNDLLVKEGFATVSTFAPDVKHQDQFLQSQRFAKTQGKGMWFEEGCFHN